MNTIIIGNAVAFAGAVLMVGIGLIRTRRSILLTQCAMFGLMGTANIILGGMTGAVSSLVSILRNVLCLRGPLSVPVKLFVIAIQILLSVKVNSLGWIGWLPIISACFYTNYVAFIFDILTILSNLYGIFSLKSHHIIKQNAA